VKILVKEELECSLGREGYKSLLLCFPQHTVLVIELYQLVVEKLVLGPFGVLNLVYVYCVERKLGSLS